MALFRRRSRTFRDRLIQKLNAIDERTTDMAATVADLDAAINRMQTAAVALLDAYEAKGNTQPQDLQPEVDRVNLIAGQLEQATATAAPPVTPAAPEAPAAPATPEIAPESAPTQTEVSPADASASSEIPGSAGDTGTGTDSGQGFVADTGQPPS